MISDRPIGELVPVERASMADRTVIQWDKDSLEELNLFKVDLLGLGALHQLHIGFDLLEEHYDRSFSMATIPKADPETFYITDHYRNYPMVLVRLARVDRDELRDLLVEAWRPLAPKRAVAAWEKGDPTT